LTSLVKEHGKQWTLIASKLEGGKRNSLQCKSRWSVLGKSNGRGGRSSSSSSSSTKQSASPNPPSKLEADSDNDDASSTNDDVSLDHILVDGFSLASAAAAPHQSWKRESTDPGTGGGSKAFWKDGAVELANGIVHYGEVIEVEGSAPRMITYLERRTDEETRDYIYSC
jgi:hypothetical protein